MTRSSILVIYSILSFLIFSFNLSAQKNVIEQINTYGKFDNWSVREIKESGIIGGQTKQLYEFYGNKEVRNTGKTPYKAPQDYIWRTNNVLAVILGIVKTSTTVFPERRGEGYCARIETHLETVKALGIVNMEVCCQGAMIVGALPEPITDTKNPMSKVFYGVPFNERPKALLFDYKADVGYQTIRATGFSPKKEMGYPDFAQALIILQKRWEDDKGNVYAKRVGTGIEIINKSTHQWINDFRLEVHYGDITKKPFFKKHMDLNNDPDTAYRVLNSKGKNVIVNEVGWASKDETPNYLIISFLSSTGKAFYGGVGNTLWIDNVRLEF